MINHRLTCLISSVIDAIYPPFAERFISRRLFRYLLCGVGNYILLDALLYYLIFHYIVAESYIDIGVIVISPHVAALILVFPITFLVGFWLNRNVAFDATTPHVTPQLIRYVISVVGSILLSYLSLKLFVEGFEIWATPAKIMSSVTTAIYSYLMAKFFTFRDKV